MGAGGFVVPKNFERFTRGLFWKMLLCHPVLSLNGGMGRGLVVGWITEARLEGEFFCFTFFVAFLGFFGVVGPVAMVFWRETFGGKIRMTKHKGAALVTDPRVADCAVIRFNTSRQAFAWIKWVVQWNMFFTRKRNESNKMIAPDVRLRSRKTAPRLHRGALFSLNSWRPCILGVTGSLSVNDQKHRESSSNCCPDRLQSTRVARAAEGYTRTEPIKATCPRCWMRSCLQCTKRLTHVASVRWLSQLLVLCSPIAYLEHRLGWTARVNQSVSFMFSALLYTQFASLSLNIAHHRLAVNRIFVDRWWRRWPSKCQEFGPGHNRSSLSRLYHSTCNVVAKTLWCAIACETHG